MSVSDIHLKVVGAESLHFFSNSPTDIRRNFSIEWSSTIYAARIAK
jgi:hypothetical protein